MILVALTDLVLCVGHCMCVCMPVCGSVSDNFTCFNVKSDILKFYSLSDHK